MWGWKKRGWLVLLVCCLISFQALPQGLSLREMIARYMVRHSLPFGAGNAGVKVNHSLDYSLTTNALFLINWQRDDKQNQVNLLQNLKYQCLLKTDNNLRFTNTFVHNLGIQYFFDSISKFNIDDNTLTCRLELPVMKKLSFTFDSRITSRLMNGFDIRTNDSGDLVRILNSSFLTPLICTFSSGIGYTMKDFGGLSLGISAAKLTYILNRHIFEIRGIKNYYGIEEGNSHLLEYGFTFQVMIDKDILKLLHWNFDLLFFKNYLSPPDITVKNLFDLRISRFLKTSIQTKIFYEEKLSRRLQFENILSVGFNLRFQ